MCPRFIYLTSFSYLFRFIFSIIMEILVAVYQVNFTREFFYNFVINIATNYRGLLRFVTSDLFNTSYIVLSSPVKKIWLLLILFLQKNCLMWDQQYSSNLAFLESMVKVIQSIALDEILKRQTQHISISLLLEWKLKWC